MPNVFVYLSNFFACDEPGTTSSTCQEAILHEHRGLRVTLIGDMAHLDCSPRAKGVAGKWKYPYQCPDCFGLVVG